MSKKSNVQISGVWYSDGYCNANLDTSDLVNNQKAQNSSDFERLKIAFKIAPASFITHQLYNYNNFKNT